MITIFGLDDGEFDVFAGEDGFIESGGELIFRREIVEDAGRALAGWVRRRVGRGIVECVDHVGVVGVVLNGFLVLAEGLR